jgi:hypothetical protein
MERCLPPEDLARILALPADDPARRHVDGCPRCRTLARRFQDFLAPSPLPPAAGATAAGKELRQRLDAALPGPRMLIGQRWKPGSGTGGPARSLRRRPARPWYAMAAVLVLAVGFLAIRHQLLAPDGLPGGQAPVLRGGQTQPEAPRLLEDSDGIKLTWQPHPETDRAVIVVLDGDLGEITRLPVADTGQHRFAPAGTPEALPPQGRYLRVRFTLAGDVVDSTRTLPLQRTAS